MLFGPPPLGGGAGVPLVVGAIGCWADLADAADKTKFPILGSLYRCVRFHLGSLAMGSFILTRISVLRAVLAYIDEKTKDLINKSEAKAKAEADLSETTVQKDGVVATLEQAASELHDG